MRGTAWDPSHAVRVIMDNIQILAQSFIDVIAWFLYPFAVMLAVSWVVSLFRR